MEKLFDKQDLVYICSPLSAPTKEEIRKNMAGAKYYSWFVAVEFGGRTIAPHSFLPEYLDDHIPQERQIALDFGLSILKICKAVVVCGEFISSGMAGEIRKARELGIKVYRLRMNDKNDVLEEMEASEDGMQICENHIS